MTAPTSISAGAWIIEILTEDLAGSVTDIFPVFTSQATLPYIIYRKVNFSQTSNKTGIGPDSVVIEVQCLAETYGESCILAEKVRAALDGSQGITDDGLEVRSCKLIDASDAWDSNAFINILTFEIKC